MGGCGYAEQLRSERDASVMDIQVRSRQARTVRPWPRAKLAAWDAALGIVLSSATVILSAVNVLSVQQTIAMALVATLTTLGGLIAWIVPDAWIAWRRGFRQGCAVASHSRRTSEAAKARRRPGQGLKDCSVSRCKLG